MGAAGHFAGLVDGYPGKTQVFSGALPESATRQQLFERVQESGLASIFQPD
jgi:hypothetical protein